MAGKRKAEGGWAEAAVGASIDLVGALTLKTNGQLARNPATRELMLEILKEAAAIPRGRRPGYGGLRRALLRECRAAPDRLSPTYRALLAGRRRRADSPLRSLLKEARAARRPAPMVRALHRIVARLEEELRGR